MRACANARNKRTSEHTHEDEICTAVLHHTQTNKQLLISFKDKAGLQKQAPQTAALAGHVLLLSSKKIMATNCTTSTLDNRLPY